MLKRNRLSILVITALAAVTLAISGCGGGDKKSVVTMTPPAQTPGGSTMTPPQTPGGGSPMPTPTSCMVGGTLSAGQSCSHESPGNRFTFTVRDDGTGCVGGICGGAGITTNNFSARKNSAGDWEVTALPGVAMTPSNGGNAPTIERTVDNIQYFKVAQAARNTPRAGSVTQSSDADANGVTADSVNIEISGPAGGQTYVASYNGMEVVSTANGTPATGVDEVLDRPKGTLLYERLESALESGAGGGVEFYRSLGQAEAA